MEPLTTMPGTNRLFEAIEAWGHQPDQLKLGNAVLYSALTSLFCPQVPYPSITLCWTPHYPIVPSLHPIWHRPFLAWPWHNPNQYSMSRMCLVIVCEVKVGCGKLAGCTRAWFGYDLASTWSFGSCSFPGPLVGHLAPSLLQASWTVLALTAYTAQNTLVHALISR